MLEQWGGEWKKKPRFLIDDCGTALSALDCLLGFFFPLVSEKWTSFYFKPLSFWFSLTCSWTNLDRGKFQMNDKNVEFRQIKESL